MNKYSKILDKLWRVPIGLFSVLVGLVAMGLCIWGMWAISIVFCIMLVVMVFGGGFLISRGIGMAFLDDQYENTGIVHDGNSLIDVKETPKYLKRKMIFCIIEGVLYVLLTIFLIFISFFTSNLAVTISCAIVSAFVSVVFFLVAASTHTDHFAKKPKSEK